MSLGTMAIATATNRGPRAFYLDSGGDDQNNGLSADHAFRSFERARSAARLADGPRTVFVSGNFTLAAPFDLGPADASTIWRPRPHSVAAITAVPGTAVGFRIRDTGRVTISGFQFHGFADSAIFGSNSGHLVITNNRISETLSTRWSQAAIHLTGSVPDAIISGNVIDGADYDGILVDTGAVSDVSRLTIEGNIVRHTCRKILDCGAIHINDRGQRSRGSVIARNRITDFGPPDTAGRGIYLDDWASYVLVHDNCIVGPGRYAFQIHAGGNNMIRRNTVDLRRIETALLYYAATENPARMVGNRIERNDFIFAGKNAPSLTVLRGPILANTRPSMSRNGVRSNSARHFGTSCGG